MLARCLTIAGSDSGGDRRADLKTFTALGVYGTSVLTALTSQNTRGVHAVSAVEPTFVANQLQAVLTDIGCDALKTGMLHTAEVIKAVVNVLSDLDTIAKGLLPLVLDPVMVSTTGHTLLDESAISTLRDQLVPLASVLTPNLPEACILAGQPPERADGAWDLAQMTDLARHLGRLGCRHVLLKGGHGGGDQLYDVLLDVAADTVTVVRHRRIDTSATHGTGCTLSAALCAYLALGHDVVQASQMAIEFVQNALRSSFPLGQGAGPVNHLHAISARIIPLPTAVRPHPFTTHLMQKCAVAWERYVWDNPFIQGLRSGTLPIDAFVSFLKQDYHFLLQYARIHALAASKCDSFDEIDATTEIVKHIVHESKLHIQTCAKHGVPFEDILAEPEADLTVAYTRYVLDLGNSKSMLHMRTAVAPCLLGYGEVALRLMADPKLVREDNPYMYWIEEYAGENFQHAVQTGRDLLERMVADEGVSPKVLKELEHVFATATRLECGFFEQSLRPRQGLNGSGPG